MVNVMMVNKEKVINKLDKELSLCKAIMCKEVRLNCIIMAVV